MAAGLRKALAFRVLLVFALVTVSSAHAAEEKWVLPAETAKLKPGPGVETATLSCILCHSADYISTQPRLNRTQWTAAVLKMQAKYGAPITTNNVAPLVDYLVANYGKENPPAK